ncbi:MULTISPECIES: transketolase [Pseudonocardia]|uniref:Ferredoxin fas2 n=2 Tax=Pseudonocardia TaxID=1847 RepID=A0A1Y2N4V8_PSEAH|nr:MULTISPECIES: transketolase [Pseudonocardia]OSY42510.1 Ferredoxin fas2 [Pseudonocardia autotrophica]TDN76029.1 transketolase [Pseudonocardia autotrophica]BBG00006.1 transketolase [Pseudonocardia autotrophica]GEC25065.1 transketolase [Pseudonocardia saturnea]
MSIGTTTTAGYDALPGLLARMTGDEKHDPASLSTLDVLWVLHDRVLRVGPSLVADPDRDRFLVSKGHGPMALYAVLAAKGFLDPAELSGFARFDSPLGHHPDRTLVPGVEISSGSLGHGLGLAVGTALGLRLTARTARTVVLVGDAELDEGSNAEAVQYAGRAGLDGLTAVVIDNSSATHGWPGGIAARFAVEDWATVDVDGRDHDALYRAFTVPHPGRPLAVVARVEPKETR